MVFAGQFFIAQISMVTFSIFCNALVLCVFHRSRHHTPIPASVHCLMSCISNSTVFTSISNPMGSSTPLHNATVYTSGHFEMGDLGTPRQLSPMKATQVEDYTPDDSPVCQTKANAPFHQNCTSSSTNWAPVVRTVTEIDRFLQKHEEMQLNEQEWKRLAYFLDKLFALIFFFASVVMAVLFKLNYLNEASNPPGLHNLCVNHNFGNDSSLHLYTSK